MSISSFDFPPLSRIQTDHWSSQKIPSKLRHLLTSPLSRLGKSANAMLIPALAALLKVKLPWSEKYGNTTLNIGRVEGGVAANVIAEDASAKIAIRLAGGTSEVAEKILLDAIASAGEELDVDVHHGYGPVSLDTDVKGEFSIGGNGGKFGY